MGWFGVGVAMFAIPVSKATGIDANILIAVSGLLMTLTIFFRHLGVDHFVYHCRTRDRDSGQLLRLAGGQRRGWAGAFKTIVPQTPLDFPARWRWWWARLSAPVH